MTITVQTCPKCSALVMSDAAECHLCHHIFDQQRSGNYVAPQLPTDLHVADDLDTCPKCGEMYRKGLVRCSNCGAFTQADIEREYQKRLEAAGRYSVESFDLPEYSGNIEEGSPRAGDDEFELTATDDDFEFELAAGLQMSEDSSPPATEVYSLKSAEAPVAEVTAPETPPAASPAPDEKRSRSEEGGIPHSEATAADVLLKIAQEEEKAVEQSKKSFRQKARGSFVVFCPNGCRIRVTERQRGRTGKCPRCGSPFVVPRKDAVKPAAKKAAASTSESAPATPGQHGTWRGWMEDIHMHAVVPTKLKIKPDSLLKDFQEVDLAFSNDGLLVMTLVKAGGLLGGAAKKKPAARAAAQEHLAKNEKLESLPVGSQRLYPTETLKQIAMAQPTPPDVESMFGGIPVFGASRIAVRLPKLGDETATQYLSFNLAQFREFVKQLQSIGGPEGLGGNTEAPLAETYNTLKCHYTDQPVQELINVQYYQGESGVQLEVSGWRCEKCSLVISEDARKKEKVGGLNGKGIAKAKCPKCGSKFGNNPLYHVAPASQPATA